MTPREFQLFSDCMKLLLTTAAFGASHPKVVPTTSSIEIFVAALARHTLLHDIQQ